MTKRTIYELPITKPRKSKLELDFVIERLSSVNNPESGFEFYDDFAEMFLLLANEIKELKERLKEYGLQTK